MGSRLLVDHIQCRYGPQPVLDELSFAVDAGEIACLLGPSGCGKTTVLHAIGGFIPLYAGQIVLDGRAVSRPGHLLPPERRRVGRVFQDYALFPHLSVQDNIAFGVAWLPARERRQNVARMLELVRLSDVGTRYPHELSGGQQQRVALARGLAPRPLLLLMDEPFSNLDSELGRQLCREVRGILKQEGMTAIVVTHDTDEATLIGDRVGILAEQRLQQWDTPLKLYRCPRNRLVAKAVGRGQSIPAWALGPNRIATELGVVAIAEPSSCWRPGDRLELFLSPDEVRIDSVHPAIKGEVVRRLFLGASTEYTLKLPSGQLVTAASPHGVEYMEGRELGLRIRTDHPVVFDTG